MPTQVQTSAPAASPASTSGALLVLIAGWLIPGGGHFLLRKPVRGALLLFSILGMLTTGLLIGGKLYQPGGDLLDLLGFLAQLGGGLPLLLARMMEWGHPVVLTAEGDWGTKFLLVAGLLNLIAAVDAHSLANGRKAS